MILHFGGMRKLDSNSVVYNDENEEHGVGHEVISACRFSMIFTWLFIDLDRLDMDRIISNKGHNEPEGHPDPKAKNLN